MMYTFKEFFIKTGGALVCFTSFSLAVHAQKDVQEDFQITEHLQSVPLEANSAFLPCESVDKVSYLELGGEKSFGNFINYYQSDNSLKYHLMTKSYFRLNPKLVLYGSMEYTRFTGQHTGTSALIDPLHAPFDIIEMNDTYRGRKQMETYRLQGAAGYRLTRTVSLGGRLDYLAANYAKHKDLRHKNTLMDMQVSLGVSWSPLPAFSAGVSYTYHRRNEALSFDTYGNTDVQYYSLISFGSFYGRQETFGESGFTSNSVSKHPPLFSQEHQGAVQVLWKRSGEFSLFNELGMSSFSGRFGTDESARITFTRHDGHTFTYGSKLVWSISGIRHVAELAMKSSKLINYENAYKESTDEANVTQIVYYGSNEVLRRKELEAKAGYTIYIGNEKKRPVWITDIETSLFYRDSRTVVYPYYRNQHLYSFRLQTDVNRNIFHRSGIYTLGVHLGYGQGGGTAYADGVYATSENNQLGPDSRNDLLMQEFEFLTSPQLQVGIAAGYERGISDKISVYLHASYLHTRAFKIAFNGTHFNGIKLTLGCRF